MGKSVREKVLYASPVKGATPRAYETHPHANSKGAQKYRGTSKQISGVTGNPPKPKSFK